MTLATTIEYTPFQETSFGYGTTELNTWFSNPDDIVKLKIYAFTGFDYSTGHVSTPSVGTAISTFNKFNMVWYVEGERDDVNAVLAKLKYFPQDYEPARIWNPTTSKTNVVTGAYGSSENPPAIPDVSMFINVRNASDELQFEGTISAEAINTEYGNQRPYWSTEPSSQDCSSLGIPPKLDLGIISHGADTENVNVKCEFRHYGDNDEYTGTAYGYFIDSNRLYVGDRSWTKNTSDGRFDFTGSVAEAQAFLNNIGYQKVSDTSMFTMFLTISDGVVESTVSKNVWFSGNRFVPSNSMPTVGFTEETAFNITPIGSVFTATHSAEVNRFWYTVTLDSTGTDGITDISQGTLSSGVFTSDYYTSVADMKTALNASIAQVRDDFDDSFTYTLQYFCDNLVEETNYSSATQTVNVTATATEEISNLTTSHNYNEDRRYVFSTGAGLPNIAHGNNVDYTARITVSDANAISVIWTSVGTSGTDFFWENGNQLRFVGTRDEVNNMINNAYFEPTIDYDQPFSFSYKQTRLGGDTTSNAANGDYYNIEIGADNCISVTGIGHDEFSITQATVSWEENTSKTFDSGLAITDLSDTHEWTSQYGTNYRVEIAMWDGLTEFTNGTIVTNTLGSLTQGGTGNQNGQGDTNMISYTGTKSDINAALASLRFIPNVDYFGNGPEVYYKLVRVYDGAVFTDQAQETRSIFNSVIDNVGYAQTSPTVNWDWNTSVEFDSGLSITDVATENSDYTHNNGWFAVSLHAKYEDDDENEQSLTTATWTSTSHGSATLSGTGTVSDPLVITGTKADVNTALANLQMLPDVDWSSAPSPGGNFWIEGKIERLHDNVVHLNFNTVVAFFNPGTETVAYNSTWGQINYNENITAQSLFAGITAITEDIEHIANVTYEASVTLGSGISTGVLLPSYGDGGYVTPNELTLVGSDDPADNYVNDFTVDFSGTRAVVNARIQALQFTPYLDRTQSSNIQLTLRRYIDGVLSTTHSTGQDVGDINGVSSSDFVYGTANSNIQYFVSGKNFSGLSNPTTVAYDLSDAVYENLTPRQIALNKGHNYDRSITITDTYEQGGGASQYKIIFSGWDGSANLQHSSAWLTKEALHTSLDNGIHSLGDFNYTNGSTQTVTFTLHRRTYDGVENQFAQGSLTYEYVSGYRLDKNGANHPDWTMVAQHHYITPGDLLTVETDSGAVASTGLNYAIQFIGRTWNGGSSTQNAGYITKSATQGEWDHTEGNWEQYTAISPISKSYDGSYFRAMEKFDPTGEDSDPVNEYGRHYSIVVWNDDGIIDRFGSQDLFTGNRLITYRQ